MQGAAFEQLLTDLHAGDPVTSEGAGRRACRGCVDLLAVDGAGIVLADGEGHVESFAVSDDTVAGLEDLQFTLGEGPAIEAHETRRFVSELSLADPARRRWPAYSPAAAAVGMQAVFALPLRVGDVGLGALDLYRRTPVQLDDAQLVDAMVMTAIVVDLLLAHQAGAEPSGAPVRSDPPGKLRARVHQAAGMVSEQAGISVDEALVRLRARAYADAKPIDDIARAVVERRLRMDESPD